MIYERPKRLIVDKRPQKLTKRQKLIFFSVFAALILIIGVALNIYRGYYSEMPIISRPKRVVTVKREKDDIFLFDDSASKSSSGLGTSYIYKYQVSTSKKTQLTFGARTDKNPKYSPDGKQIVFIRNSFLYTIDANIGNGEFLLCYFNGKDFSFTPDGKRIIFVENTDICTFELSSSRNQILQTGISDQKFNPLITLDSKNLLFFSLQKSDYFLFVSDLNDLNGPANNTRYSKISFFHSLNVAEISPNGKKLLIVTSYNDIVILDISDLINIKEINRFQEKDNIKRAFWSNDEDFIYIERPLNNNLIKKNVNYLDTISNNIISGSGRWSNTSIKPKNRNQH